MKLLVEPCSFVCKTIQQKVRDFGDRAVLLGLNKSRILNNSNDTSVSVSEVHDHPALKLFKILDHFLLVNDKKMS